MNFRPMLAASIEESDLDQLRFPVLIQPKFDGIRCCIVKGRILTRSLKPLPNFETRIALREWLFNMKQINPYLIDGELMVRGSFQNVQSAFMSQDGKPDFTYNVFDWANTESDLKRGYDFRNSDIKANTDMFRCVESYTAYSIESLLEIEQRILKIGFEGIIIRPILGPYKFGRSTLKEGYLLKLKRFIDAEAKVIGFVEQEINNNPSELNERGYSTRSTHQAGMIKVDTLGALKVVGINGQFKGVEFEIGSGFTKAERDYIWLMQHHYMNKIWKYKYQKIGSMNRPRQPIALGERKD